MKYFVLGYFAVIQKELILVINYHNYFFKQVLRINNRLMSKIVTLTEAAGIALHGITIIAKSEKGLNVLEVADRIGSSKHHVAKVFQRLVKENFLGSTRGPSGGFVLKKKPEEIKLLDVYEAIEGKIDINTCPLEKKNCPFDSCILENITVKMTEQFRNYLESHTLADFL